MSEGRELLLQLKRRLAKLQLAGEITKEQETSIVNHLEASLKFGLTEVMSHSEMTDEELVS